MHEIWPTGRAVCIDNANMQDSIISHQGKSNTERSHHDPHADERALGRLLLSLAAGNVDSRLVDLVNDMAVQTN